MARRCSWSAAFASLAWVVWIPPTPAWPQSAAVAPGDTVRVQPPSRIEIPDVLTIDSGRLQTRKAYEDKDGVVVVHDGDRTLHVPRPGRRLTGRLVGVTDEVVTLREGKDRTILVPRQAVERLEVRRRGHPWVGGLLGAAAGFALGYAIGYGAEKDCSGSGWCMPEAAGVGLGLLLAIPGGGVGAVVAGGRWEPVSLENLRVGVALRKDGATAGVTLSF